MAKDRYSSIIWHLFQAFESLPANRRKEMRPGQVSACFMLSSETWCLVKFCFEEDWMPLVASSNPYPGQRQAWHGRAQLVYGHPIC